MKSHDSAGAVVSTKMTRAERDRIDIVARAYTLSRAAVVREMLLRSTDMELRRLAESDEPQKPNP